MSVFYRKNRVIFFFLICSLFLLMTKVYAAGPKKVAKTDRSLWPYPINSPSGFDFASRMEMYVFVEQLIETQSLQSEVDIKKYLGLKRISVESIAQWRSKIWTILIGNFKDASLHHGKQFIFTNKNVSKGSLSKTALSLKNEMPQDLVPWYTNTRMFYKSYLYEQMRLAALFPRITSEIMTLDNSEIQGFKLKDKSFMLTFDDGPSKKNGNTDRLVSTLRENNLKGTFFVLGKRFKLRLNKESISVMGNLYKGMELGSHGMVHKSHAKYSRWKSSLSITRELVDSVETIGNKSFYFRPPYGQRSVDVVNYLKGSKTRVMLWNIDSQDWNRKISSKETADRVISLMLLWRSGIVLYHDVYPKANTAVPIILKYFKGAGLSWL